jgi:undecaprenyl-diphosphatase
MQRLPLRHAVALGLLHGPTELLPVSSSGHTTLVPWLARWPYGELDPELRKSFEVALHAGTAAALLLHPPWAARKRQPSNLGVEESQPRVGAKLGFLLPAVIPPALIGYGLGGQIERRLGAPSSIVVGLLAGSVAMLASDWRARTRIANPRSKITPTVDTGSEDRHMPPDAGPLDGLLLGLAQALALMPGVSRSGATLAAARSRGFSRQDADRLSWRVGLPVIAGAALLKGTRLVRDGMREPTQRGLGLRLAAGGASAFLSTLASSRLLGPERRTSLLPACAIYRGALAALVIRRMRDNTSQHAPPIPKK